MIIMGIIGLFVTGYFLVGLLLTYRAIAARRVEEPFEEVEIHTLYPDFTPEIIPTEQDKDGQDVVWINPRVEAYGVPRRDPDLLPQAPVVLPVSDDFIYRETREEMWARIEAMPAPVSPWLKPIEVSPATPVPPVEDVVDDDDHDDSVKSDYKK